MSDSNLLTNLTADIVVSMVANNSVSVSDLPGLIGNVHSALAGLGQVAAAAKPEYTAATTIRKSLSDPTKIISMIDGKPYAMLKRHLGLNGLTPAEYRIRYTLPADYPMVAPAYSEQRKQLAIKIGLGRKRAVVKPVAKAKPRAPKAPIE
ncbi:MucR family transcriptional regulator [Sphingobium boeckii]|uniref:Putative transcriptional regulator n=1 Tax=Sphingobium boeckii TaxID=1082345 RepID=A0A7W9EDK1_9SPHN|nr:MucR family transcriptional regulator [Sphingobium boeckii]MBB5685009.1 putative transcriptional regulator [Sphingobium boeckii]